METRYNYIIMLSLIIIVFLSHPVFSQLPLVDEQCKCEELFTEGDCNYQGLCKWNPLQMNCRDLDIERKSRISTNLKNVNPASSISIFCQNFAQNECSKQLGCAWLHGKCVMFTGCTSYSKQNDEDCRKISNKCFSDGVRCIELGDCDSYLFPQSCKITQNGTYCFWNRFNNKCENVQACIDLPQTLTTDEECRTHLYQCTVNENGNGCIESGKQCKDQKYVGACVTDQFQKTQCFWDNYQCLELDCENAPKTYINDQQCKEFLNICTTKKEGGCTIRKQCHDAQIEQACVQDENNNDCFWDGIKCFKKSCENAPDTFTTNQQCKSISNTCISNGKGCVQNYQCSTAQFEQFCVNDINNNDCIWIDNSCQQKTCQNASNTFVTDEQCKNYMSNCILRKNEQKGCQLKQCEDAPVNYNSNEQCEEYYPNQNCITKINGGCKKNTICLGIDIVQACNKDADGQQCYWNQGDQKCYQLTLCSLIKSKVTCVTDIDGQPCQWLEPLINNSREQCVNKSCHSAPLYFSNERQCNEYFKDCIPQKGGGCKQKKDCSNADILEGCTSDINGNKCIWEQNKCRKQECTDIQESSFTGCNSVIDTCTIGQISCSKMDFCNNYKQRYQCIKGLDGQCLWIENILNQDNEYGNCFQFDSCQSLKWKTDAECKLASENCTTDGQQCVPITLCRQTNTNGGCIIGTDGECIQTVPELFSSQPKMCSQFINCKYAYYLTHEECQHSHSFCTTNGISGCQDLTACFNYQVSKSCHINNLGTIKNKFGLILSTGKCVWDSQKLECRDEKCSDLIYTTDKECQQSLFYCTSNGIHCVQKENCENYITQDACNIKTSIHGSCFWNISQQSCFLKQCNEIKASNENDCQEVSNCVFDGFDCVKKVECSQYKTKISCNNQGIDGYCAWNLKNNQCILMESCESAQTDKTACNMFNDRCIWNDNLCRQHTCKSYYLQEGKCHYFLTWDKNSYNICKLNSGICESVDVKTLSQEECYQYSIYKYSWNPISNKCVQCSRIINNSTNKTIKEYNQSVPTQWQYIITSLASFFTLAL